MTRNRRWWWKEQTQLMKTERRQKSGDDAGVLQRWKERWWRNQRWRRFGPLSSLLSYFKLGLLYLKLASESRAKKFTISTLPAPPFPHPHESNLWNMRTFWVAPPGRTRTPYVFRVQFARGVAHPCFLDIIILLFSIYYYINIIIYCTLSYSHYFNNFVPNLRIIRIFWLLYICFG